jgi:hypothetical protein
VRQLGTTAHGLLLLTRRRGRGDLFGLTVMLVALAAAGASAVRPVGPTRRWRAPAVALTATTAVAAGSVPWTEPSETVTVAAFQVDPVRPGRYAVDCPGDREEPLARLLAATDEIDDRIGAPRGGAGPPPLASPGGGGLTVLVAVPAAAATGTGVAAWRGEG